MLMARLTIDESPLAKLAGVLSPRAALIPAGAPPSPNAETGAVAKATPNPTVSNPVIILEIYPFTIILLYPICNKAVNNYTSMVH